jgi:transcriptional regulator with XRE-family HTH domain
MNYESLPNNLKLVRKEAGLRQIDVAHKLGFTTSERISAWEKGKCFPSIVNLFKISVVYEKMPHELYCGLLNALMSLNNAGLYFKFFQN